MTILAGLLDQPDLSDEELAGAICAAITRTSQGGAGSVSVGMTDFLARTTPRGRSKSTTRTMECVLSDRACAEQLTAQHGAVQAARTLARLLSTHQAAILLSRIATTITHAAGRTLCAYREGWSLGFPTWQFREGRPIPGLVAMAPVLREGLIPAITETRMTTSDPKLLDGVTSAQQLITGEDPAAVVQQLLDAGCR